MKNDKNSDVMKDIAYLGGVALGIFVTKAVVPMVFKPAVANAPSQKEILTKAGVQAGLSLATGYGYTMVGSDDSMSLLLKGGLAGMAGTNLIDAGGGFISSSTTVKEKLMANNVPSKMLRNGFGLGCPCTTTAPTRMQNTPYLNGYGRRRNGMGTPGNPANGNVRHSSVIVL